MIIPVRCFTCGNVIADKWLPYTKLVSKNRKEINEVELLDIDSLVSNSNSETAESIALKELDIQRICCRRHFLCNVDMIDVI